MFAVPTLPLGPRSSTAISHTPLRFSSLQHHNLHRFLYDVHAIEAKWRTTKMVRLPPANREKFYLLAMFPYPSGSLHMGHVRVYTLSDTLARFHRMAGRNVIHPMGWDAFGLPAENAAVDRNVSPKAWTLANIQHMKSQLALIGVDFDPHTELATCHPGYYKFTQVLFLKLFSAGLAYQKDALVNWDPIDNTVLANEQVDAHGRSWRSGAIVYKKRLKQWFFRITSYAQELLSGLDDLDWPDDVKQMQRNWIGQSHGMKFAFNTSHNQPIEVFTTRPETLMGVTFLALSPSHPILTSECIPAKYRGIVADTAAQFLHDQQHAHSDPPKRGLFLNIYAAHPISKSKVPVYMTNYVLSEYGTGAVMGVPAHDDRDFEFAQSLGIASNRTTPVFDAKSGRTMNSGPMTNLTPAECTQWLAEHQFGTRSTQYRLRDWLISRQRYWGCPIPIVHCPSCGPVPIPESDLPVLVPNSAKDHFSPERLAYTCPKCSGPGTLDPDTMDTFVDSSWYYLRYLDRNNTNAPFDPDAVNAGMPVDLYIGGIEHAILHLLYARFMTRAINDHVTPLPMEPFRKLLAQGMVHGRTFRDPHSGRYLKPNEVEADPPRILATGLVPRVTYEKMSKSKYNGCPPEDVIAKFGTDVLRAYIIAKAPPSQVLEWDDHAIVGQARWANRVWGLVADRCRNGFDGLIPIGSGHILSSEEKKLSATFNQLHTQITHSLETTASLNTYPSNLIKMTHALGQFNDARTKGQRSPVYDACLVRLVQVLAPLMPSLALELWTNQLCLPGSVWDHWPVPEHVQLADTVPVVVQVNGRVRGTIAVSPDQVGSDLPLLVRQAGILDKWVPPGTVVQKFIVAKNNKLVNFVVS